MVDTVRTITDLVNNLFQDAQPPGSITAQRARDLIASTINVFTSVQTAAYTLVLADRGTTIRVNIASGSGVITVPLQSSVAFPTGTIIRIRWVGTVQPVVTPASSVTFVPSGAQRPTAVGSLLTLTYNGSDVWYVDEDLSPSAGTPIRGTLDVTKYFIAQGGVVGTGQSSGQRTTNATALQAAYTQAVNNNLYMEQAAGVYQYNGTVGIPAGEGIVFRGSMGGAGSGVQLRQYGTNIPAFIIGDPTGVTGSGRCSIKGLNIDYGVSQTGNTSAFTLRIGDFVQSDLEDVYISGNFIGYNAIQIDPTGNFFSNHLKNVEIKGFQNDGMHFAPTIGSSGSLYENIYISQGGLGAPAAITGSCLNWGIVSAENEHFIRLNIEWTSGNVAPVMDLSAQKGMVLEATHLEGCTLTGASGWAIDTTSGVITFVGLTIADFNTASATGTPMLFRDWPNGANSTHVDGMVMSNNHASQITTAFRIFGFNGPTLRDDVPNFSIDNFRCRSLGSNATDFITQAALDVHMPQTTFPFPTSFTRYEYGAGGSVVNRAVIPVSATYTHYGQHTDAMLVVPFSITSFTITLAATQGATGTQAVTTGNTVHIRRTTGTVSGTLTIKDDASTTLATNTTSSADLWFVFNPGGTNHYVSFTPVT